MPFSKTLGYRFITLVLRVQKRPLASYVVASLAVVAATVARILLNERLPEGIPFITYYPAILIATLGGFWPGVWATVISSILAWYFFIPPAFVWSLDQKEALSLLVFVFNSAVIVAIMTLLSRAIEQIKEEEQRQHGLLEREKLLHQELRHRTRNFLAIVVAIINRTLIDGRTVGEAKQILIGRVHALAEANAMLAEAVWSGVSLREILAREFEGFPEQPDIKGCDINVNARAAQEFALLVHELGTNSVKFGAWSVENGHVLVEGKTDQSDGEQIFYFIWREVGGPPIHPRPTAKGLGNTILLESGKPFGGQATIDFNPNGLIFELRLPFKAITERASFLINHKDVGEPS